MYCRKCGTWCEEHAVFCNQCGEVLGEKTVHQGQSDETATDNINYNSNSYYTYYESHNMYAGFWKRFLAALIDGIVLIIIGGLISCVLIFKDVPNFVPTIFSMLLGWLYSAFMESSEYQGTIGKMALHIWVTDLDGNRIGFGRATGRFFGKYLSQLILWIGYMMAGWTQKKQALHDMMAGTLVVEE